MATVTRFIYFHRYQLPLKARLIVFKSLFLSHLTFSALFFQILNFSAMQQVINKLMGELKITI